MIKSSFLTNSYNKIFTFIIICCSILPVSVITLDPADFKKLFFLIFAPFFLYVFLYKVDKNNHCNTISLKSIWPSLLFLFFILYIFINWYLKSYPYYGNQGLIYHWLCLIGFLLGVFILSSELFFKRFLISFNIILTIASLYAILEYFGYVPPLALSKYPVEITGLVGHKNTFGFLIMASLPWNVYLLLAKNGNSPNQKKLIIITSLIQFIALILSDSRGSLVLTISGIVFVAIPIILKNNILSNFRNRLVLYISILCLGLLPVLLWNEVTWIRIAGLLSNTQSNITARPVIYQAQWKMFLNHPVFGNGVGNFVYLNIPFWTDSFRKASAPFNLPRNGHCDYLETLCELGLTGFLLTLFFWTGAIILAIKQLRKQKDLSILPNLIVLILMMTHAGFSTASRHIPSGILLWMIVGLLWHPVFKRGWFSLPQKGKTYFGIVSVTMHVIVTGLLLQIIVGDAFYLSFRKNKARKNKPVSLLQKSLKVCPFNPNALFQTAYLSLRTKEYDFALQCADQLDRTAPNLKPTDFIRGIAAFHTGDYQASLKYTNNALYREPNYFDAKLLKAKSLAKLGKCEELKKIQKPFRPPDKNMKKLDTTTIINPTVINHDSLFVIQTGYLRTKIGGPFLRKSFNKMQHYYKFKGNESKTKIDEILSLPCPPPFKED